MKRTKRFDYNIDGVFVRLVNCSVPGNHRQLAPTAEAWLRYARYVYGPKVRLFEVAWDDYGRVSHRVETDKGTEDRT